MKRLLVFAMIGLLFTSEMTVSAAGLKDIYNAEYYADSYQDLKNAYGEDEDALYQHFLTYGLAEGRNMSPVLDVVKYREKYADLDAAFGDNWDAYVEHYFTYGIKEGRDSGTFFNVKQYLEAYQDLRMAYGENYEAAVKHYLQYGLAEGRTGGNKISKKITPVVTVEQNHKKSKKKSESEFFTRVEILPNGIRIEFLVNSFNQEVQETHYAPDGNLILQVKNEFGADGTIVKSAHYTPEGICMMEMEYNANGQPAKSTNYDPVSGVEMGYTIFDYDPAGNQIQTNYDVNGTRLGKVKVEQNANGSSTHTFYNEDDSVDMITEHGMDGRIIKSTYYSYDASGNVTETRVVEYNEDGSIKSDSASASSMSVMSLYSLSLNDEVMEGELCGESVIVEPDENVDVDSEVIQDELIHKETESDEDSEGKDEVTEPEEGEEGEVTEPEERDEDEVTEPEEGEEGEVTEPEEGEEGEVTESETKADESDNEDESGEITE